MEKRFWGTTEHPYTSYACGVLCDVYESLFYKKVQVYEEMQFYDIHNKLVNKYRGRINI